LKLAQADRSSSSSLFGIPAHRAIGGPAVGLHERPHEGQSMASPSTAAAPAASSTCGSMPSGSPQGLEKMDVNTLFSMSAPQQKGWMLKMLGPLQAQVRSRAACHMIPSQLLATVLLNELADINGVDVWQQRLGMNGSLGIAQIQVDTALKHKLLDFPGDAAMIRQQAANALLWHQALNKGISLLTLADFERLIRAELIRQRLTIPEFAVEAAAAEIQQILDRMTQNAGNPWQASFSFTLTSMSQLKQPNDIYNYIAGSTQRDKEMNLGEMVTAAYNSPDIVIAKQQASINPGSSSFIYSNATIHGSNSRHIAARLYDDKLFH
jgi:hypothetical protein